MFPKFNNTQMSQLWKQKILFYQNRRSRKFSGRYLIPVITLFLSIASADFRIQVIYYSIAVFVLYLIMVKVIQGVVDNKKYLEKLNQQYALVSLLLNIDDLMYLTITFMSIWSIGIYNLTKIISVFYAEKIIMNILICTLVIALLSSRFVLNSKSRNQEKQQGVTYLTLILLGAIPGVALSINLFLDPIVGIKLPQITTIFFSFFTAVLFLPNFVWAIFEILFLGLQKWPEIKYDESKIVIKYANETIAAPN